jgi:hypothetical protein
MGREGERGSESGRAAPICPYAARRHTGSGVAATHSTQAACGRRRAAAAHSQVDRGVHSAPRRDCEQACAVYLTFDAAVLDHPLLHPQFNTTQELLDDVE